MRVEIETIHLGHLTPEERVRLFLTPYRGNRAMPGEDQGVIREGEYLVADVFQ